MDDDDEMARERDRDDDTPDEEPDRPENPGNAAFLGRVVTEAAQAGTFIRVARTTILGDQTEGGEPLFTEDGHEQIVYALGPAAPRKDDIVICRSVSQRWVAEKIGFGPATVVVAGCPCVAIPRTLTMTVTNPNTNGNVFHSCTLQYYQPVPDSFAPLALGPWAYLSTESFHDDYSPDDTFWYWLFCFQGYYVINRVYLTSIYGSPFRDAIRYRWLIGLAGNTCAPFQLTNGLIFTGADKSCKVEITG